MGRGLSPLQTVMLQIAWQQRPSRQPSPDAPWGLADIYAQDLYVRHYGWPITYGRWLPGGTRGLGVGQSYHFAPATIGERPYRTVSAAVSRAFHRLARRGLLTRRGNGWCLTTEGCTVAEQLSVNTYLTP